MSNLVKVSDQLMGLTISELTQVQSMIQDIKTMKAKSALSVGANVFARVMPTPNSLRCSLAAGIPENHLE